MILPISHYLPLHKRGLLARALLLTLITVLVSCGSIIFAQDKSAPKKLSSPDALVLVLSGMGPNDQVSINYATAVSKIDAQKDLDVLAKSTGWVIQNQSITTQAGHTPGAKPTTSANFQVSPIVDARQGTFPLEPFLVALKRFKTIQVNYLVASQFPFQGLKNFENDYVKINLGRSGNSYLYTVDIKNSNFDRLDLPLREQNNAPKKAPMPLGARIMIIVGMSLVGAVLVYIIVSYLTKARERR